MKHLLTLTLLSLSFHVAGQDTWNTDPKFKSGQFSIAAIDYNKSDTVKVWFKETVISTSNLDTLVTNGKSNLNNAVKEFWQHGYMVTFPNKPIPLDEVPLLVNSRRKFLYNDKSTVKNLVLTFTK